MKILAVFLFCFIVSVPILAYGQLSDNGSLIYVQVQLRNSDGKLVTYIEGHKITILHQKELDQFLDSQPIVTTITDNGQNYDLYQIPIVSHITSDTIVSKTGLGTVTDGKPILFAFYGHDGYPIVRGDTLTVTWIVLRPAH